MFIYRFLVEEATDLTSKMDELKKVRAMKRPTIPMVNLCSLPKPDSFTPRLAQNPAIRLQNSSRDSNRDKELGPTSPRSPKRPVGVVGRRI